MSHYKKITLTLTAILSTALLVAFLVTIPSGFPGPSRVIAAAGNTSAKDADSGVIDSKEEVIYARLAEDGTVEDIYSINILNIVKDGLVNDYGGFTTLKNLSSTAPIHYQDDRVTVEAKAGRFYYQGNLSDQQLPWRVSLDYNLDGATILPSELSGKSGLFELRIKTSVNETITPTFYDHYLLQITITLDTTKCSDITAYGAVFANSGGNKLITFTVMPKKSADLKVTAKVKDFSMEGIQISAVPFTMNIDIPDTSLLTEDLTMLSDAIAQLGDGVGILEDGMKELNSGTTGLYSGSAEFSGGIHKLDASSSELVSGSKSISEALAALSTSLQSSLKGDDLTALLQLPDALTQLSDGLTEISEGMKALSSGYDSAFTAMDSAIRSIPTEDISPEDLLSLTVKNPFNQTLDRLLDYYKAAQTIKYTYVQTEPAFTAVKQSLTDMATSLDTISASLDTVALQLSSPASGSTLSSSIMKLVMGINTLSTNYKEFHEGLKEYTAGVSALSDNYAYLYEGIAALAEGTEKMADGIEALNSGTEELIDKTKDMPSQMEATIDTLLSDYDTSAYTPISFVSEKNEHVSSVQFVLRTAAIQPVKEAKPVASPTDKETVWTRLLNLFQKIDLSE